MKIRTQLAAAVATFGLLTTVPAHATELREPKAHVVVDVPNSWSALVEGNYAVAYPQDQSFHLRLRGTTHGYNGEANAEEHAMQFLADHFDNVKVSQHGKKVDWGNFIGVEVFGTGFEKTPGHAPGRFFLLVLFDKKDNKRGVVALGTGSNEGFDRHRPGIYEALHTLRTY